jgi:ATP-dependent helicase/nuclease subunit B
MGVTFVIGRAGSGKTARCFGRIVEALREDPLGAPIYWILPRQATFLAERELTCASGLGGFCRARVLSFDELGKEVLGECGGGAVPEVTQLGRQMILGHLLRKHAGNLRFFDKVAHQPGLAVKLAATLAEFERCGKDPGQLEGLVKELGDGDDPFFAKLHDLQLIYKAYTDYLGQERLDPCRRMEQVLRCIGESRRLGVASVYVDGFAEFDEFERRMLAKLGKTCRRVEITLLMDGGSPVLRHVEQRPEEMSLFHRLEEVYRRLRKALADEGAVVEKEVVLRGSHRFKAAALGVIEREMFERGRAVEGIESGPHGGGADERTRMSAADKNVCPTKTRISASPERRLQSWVTDADKNVRGRQECLPHQDENVGPTKTRISASPERRLQSWVTDADKNVRGRQECLPHQDENVCPTKTRISVPPEVAQNNRSAEADPTMPASLELVEAPDRRAEVEHAARKIKELLRGGMRLREIAVLVRRLELYHDLINAAFGEHGIRYFVDRRRTMAHHPLLQFVRAVLMIARQGWPHDAVMMLMKSGLGGLTGQESDRLENYVLEHRLRGGVWGREEAWNWRRRMTRGGHDEEGGEADESGVADELRRRVRDRLRSFMDQFVRREGEPPGEPGPMGTRMSPADKNVCPTGKMVGRAHPTNAPQGGSAGALSSRTVREIVVALWEVFRAFGVRETLGGWITQARERQEHEQAGEHEQAWKDLMGLLDQMVDLLGQERVGLGDFQDILESALETFDLALTPPTVDEVLVGQVDRTRTPEVKAVLLLGMNDGVFPYAPREVSVLSDSERDKLQEHQFNVEPGSERRLLDENLLGYIAFSRASERLYVSRSLADDAGRPLGASVYWINLRGMFPGLEPKRLPRDERDDFDLIDTPRQLLTALMRWVRENARHEGTEARRHEVVEEAGGESGGEHWHQAAGDTQAAGVWPALYQWVARHPTDDGAVDLLRYRVWKALRYDNAAGLEGATAGGLFPRPLKAGVWQIEMYASCPFRHFMRYGLGLEQRDEAEWEAIDLEQALHRILENLAQDMLRRGGDWASLSDGGARDLVLEYVRQVGKDLRGEKMLSQARNRYLLGRIERALEQVMAHQRAVAERGKFRPAFAKVEFGDGALPALVVRTPKGEEIHLHGWIDRVDVLEATGAAAVVDYRLYGGELSLWKVYHGLSLHLLVCLSVLEAHGEKLAGKKLKPAAAFYVRLLRQLEKVEHPADAPEPGDPKFPLRGKQRGIFDEAYFRDIDSDLECTNSDVVAARLKKDGTFGYRGTTDVAETEELVALLRHARKQLARLGDEILEGKIEIAPYRLGTTSPCSSCSYRGVCRFDPAINRYHHIRGMKREEVLRIVAEEGGHE